MSRIIAETTISSRLRKFHGDQILMMADMIFDVSSLESIKRGRENDMLDKLDPSINAFEVKWPIKSHPLNIINNDGPVRKYLYFFATSEQEILDRILCAEVLLL